MRPGIRRSLALSAAVVASLSCGGGEKPKADGGGAYVRVVAPSEGVVGFTSAAGDNTVALRAELSGPAVGGAVTWEVTPTAGSGSTGVAIPSLAIGPTANLVIPAPGSGRWERVSHPSSAAARAHQLLAKSIAFQVVAIARKGSDTYRSAPLEIRQNEIGTLREEYEELDVPQGVPAARSIVRQSPETAAATPNGGDYDLVVRNAAFDVLLNRLKQRWLSVHSAGEWQINGGYRNPVHNRFHVGRGVGSGSVSSSWHQYGCAADLQTFPTSRNTTAQITEATLFWDAMANEALLLGFDVEPLQSANGSFSGLGHVHVEKDCPL